jgi:hypothetical protein
MAGHRDQIVGQCDGHTARRATVASLLRERLVKLMCTTCSEPMARARANFRLTDRARRRDDQASGAS